MSAVPSIEHLWETSPRPTDSFEQWSARDLPEPALRYVERSVPSGVPLAQAVRLRMHGELKLGRWRRFEAEQVIRRDRGMLRRATAHVNRLPVAGYDAYLDGTGSQRWKLLGILPVVRGAGADITRSSAGRFLAELIWLPSALAGSDVTWTADGSDAAVAHVAHREHAAELRLSIDADGTLRRLDTWRWGDPDGGGFRLAPFGAIIEETRQFDGYTIPVRTTVGWFGAADRQAPDGGFFRGVIDSATYR